MTMNSVFEALEKVFLTISVFSLRGNVQQLQVAREGVTTIVQTAGGLNPCLVHASDQLWLPEVGPRFRQVFLKSE